MKKWPKLILLVTSVTLAWSSYSLGASKVWRIQTGLSKTETRFKIFTEFTDKIKVMTQGELEIQAFPRGELSDNKGAYSAIVKAKHFEGMRMTPQYLEGVDPALPVFGDLVAAWNHPWEYDLWLQEGGGLEILQEIYNESGLALIGYTLTVHESIIASTPIDSIDDFKGVMMRTPPGMITSFFEKLGAAARLIDSSQVSEVLENGTIQAADYSTLGNNYKSGMYKKARHTVFPGFHSMVLSSFVVRKELWDELPPHIQQILKTAAYEWNTRSTLAMFAENYDLIEKIEAEGVVLHSWSQHERNRARAAAFEVWDEYALKSPRSKQVVDSLKKHLRKLGNVIHSK